MEPLLKVEGLQKSFGGVAALRNGSFELHAGSVHALCGGNGAGKSTFLSIVMGIQRRDAGRIWFRGKPVEFGSPADALASGIAMIEQELSPVTHMTVAENIYLGREPGGRFGGIDFRAMNKAARAILESLSFDVSPDRRMMELSVAQMQLVEIAKALSYDAEVIIMDEPTSALGEREADQLFAAISRLRSQGKGIVYVTHRLSEIFRIADSYTVFRDGSHIGSGAMADTTRQDLIRMIVGREMGEEFVKANAPTDDVAFEVRGLSADGRVRDISFAARRGEILGIYGLMGSGRTEIFNAVFGLDPSAAGHVAVHGRPVEIRTPADAMAAGIALVTEDRKQTGLNLSDSVRANLCMANLRAMSPFALMDVRREASASAEMIERFQIKVARDAMPVAGLSGGNQQKVVLGKWFMRRPRVLLLDEPTRGVDVGAKREIYRTISDFAAEGGTVVMISSEIDEVLGMADRILVMHGGSSVGTFDRAEIDAQKLVHLAA